MDDFEAALAAKLAPAEDAGTTGEETAAEEPAAPEAPEAAAEGTEQAQGPPRDPETGRFVSPESERPEWLPPKFKSAEDLARAYSELESAHGRQGQEIGELRRLAEQIAQNQQSPQPHVGQVQAALEENPEGVAYWAAQQGNEQVLDLALQAWHQKALDEGDAVSLRQAQRFERDLELARLQYEWSQEVAPSIEQVREEASKRALALARHDLASRYPDFDQVMQSVTEEDVQGLDPNVLGGLAQADPKAALEMVYRWVATGRKVASLAEQDASREEDRQRKREATVASSSAAPATREKSNVEVFKEFILQPEPHAIRHGLTRE